MFDNVDGYVFEQCSNPKLASTTLVLIEVRTGLISMYLAHFLYCITTVDGFLCRFPRSIFFRRPPVWPFSLSTFDLIYTIHSQLPEASFLRNMF